jgi:hypothetical protein
MTHKHTPGPWACTYTSNYAHDYRLTQPNGQPLPVNAEANNRSEQRANARLIAAAPDILKALEDVLMVFSEEYSDSPTLERARAAIAKATQEPTP